MIKTNVEIEELAIAHAKYTIDLVATLAVEQEIVSLVNYIYKRAMIHGYKHAIEDINNC